MTESTLTMFVWTIFAAILAAAVYSFAVQRVLSGFVGRLIKADADAPEKAKTLKQLGYTGAALSFLVRTFVRGGSPLARAVTVCTPQTPDLNNTELLFAEKAELSYTIFRKKTAPKALKSIIRNACRLPRRPLSSFFC